jgi:hypothetical protein
LEISVILLKTFFSPLKLYIAAVIWYCYGYITALKMARTIGTFTAHSDGPQPIIGEVRFYFLFPLKYFFFFSLLKMYSPPKYEEAIKSNYQEQENYSPPPYTPLLQSSSM